jgi:hypothetical protein
LAIALATAATLALVHSTDELRLRLMTSARRTPVDSPDAQLMPAAIAAKVGLPVPEILTGTRVQFQHTPTPPLPLARAPTMPGDVDAVVVHRLRGRVVVVVEGVVAGGPRQIAVVGAAGVEDRDPRRRRAGGAVPGLGQAQRGLVVPSLQRVQRVGGDQRVRGVAVGRGGDDRRVAGQGGGGGRRRRSTRGRPRWSGPATRGS